MTTLLSCTDNLIFFCKDSRTAIPLTICKLTTISINFSLIICCDLILSDVRSLRCAIHCGIPIGTSLGLFRPSEHHSAYSVKSRGFFSTWNWKLPKCWIFLYMIFISQNIDVKRCHKFNTWKKIVHVKITKLWTGSAFHIIVKVRFKLWHKIL